MDRRIPVQIESVAARDARLGASWGVGNKLTAFSAPRVHDQRTGNVSQIVKAGEVHTVAFETSLYTAIFRKLVNESSQTFLSLQKMALEEENILKATL